MSNIAIEHGPVEIVDLPIDSMVIFHGYVAVYQRVELTCNWPNWRTVLKWPHIEGALKGNCRDHEHFRGQTEIGAFTSFKASNRCI
jgi:hypothetical protein